MDNINTYDALLRYGEITVERMAKALKDTKNLKRDIDSEVIVSGDGNMQLKFNIPDYGIFVDQGRYPWGLKGTTAENMKGNWKHRFPPPNVIAAWAKSKGLPQFRDKKGRYMSHNSRAFLISRAIAVKGIKPRPFISLIYSHIQDLDKMLGSGVAADIAVSLAETFNSLPNATANI